jgi:hypothetical protein
MQAEETDLDKIEIKKLKWLGHLMRMPQERWPTKIHPWIPAGRRKRVRPRQSGRDGVTQAMGKMGDGYRRCTAPDTLEKITRMAADRRINKYI